MAATLTVTPDAVSFDGNPIPIEFQSSLYVPQSARVELEFSNRPNADDYVELTWNNITVRMTAKASPDSSGTQFPSTGGATLADYVDSVQEAFLQNEIFNKNLSINRGSGGGIEYLILLWPPLEIVDITATDALVNCAVVVTDFAGLSVDNLRTLVRIYKGGIFVGALHAPYNPATVRSHFDLSDILELEPHLPDVASFSGSWASRVATNAYSSYFFRYADKYGAPAVAEALVKSNTYHLIHGALSADTLDTFFGIFNEYICHNYEIIGTSAFPKTLTTAQPDWMYYYAKAAKTARRVHAIVTWSDGTTEHHVVSSSVSFSANVMYYFPVGYTQLGLGALTNGDEIITKYRVQIGTLDIPGDNTSLTNEFGVNYALDLDPFQPWTNYLCFFNGVGGCETVALKGKTQRRYDAQRERVELEDGTLLTINARARHIYEMSTGFMDINYVNHLRQLLLGRVWLVDVANARFIEVVLNTNSIEVEQDDTDPEMHNLTFEISFAQEDAHYNNY